MKIAGLCVTVIAMIVSSGAHAQSSSDPTETNNAQQDAGNLSYYGHYWVDSKSYGSHIDEVGSHCNVQWVESIDGLKKCATKKRRCILQVRWEFFAGGAEGGKTPNPLRGDYEDAWGKTARAITPYIDSVDAFYVIDEPYWVGVTPKDLDTAISAVKKSFPRKPVMVVFAVPSFTQSFVVPAKADWVGFDVYKDIATVALHMRFLKNKLRTHQRIFLVPQSFMNKTAPDDKALARLNWEYYELARNEPRVIGLLAFGLFTHAKAAELPLTLEAQREIGERIIKNSRTSASSGHAEA